MTLAPVMRVFFAIDLSAPDKEKLGDFIGALKKQSRTNAIRWTKPENLHVTLQFLAQVQAEHLPQLIHEVRAKTEGAMQQTMEIKLDGLHLFPNPYRPRVIVLDIYPQEDLVALSRLIGEGIQRANYEIETRPFRAHLTLGRIKLPQDVNLNFLSKIAMPTLDEINIQEVVLFRSDPGAEGSKYIALEKINLYSLVEDR